MGHTSRGQWERGGGYCKGKKQCPPPCIKGKGRGDVAVILRSSLPLLSHHCSHRRCPVVVLLRKGSLIFVVDALALLGAEPKG